ncbi:MAG TPA: siderophore-interacting protein [Acidimicrobiales bacterium]|jgi:NADPH-dependent ferric siderophore reductase
MTPREVSEGSAGVSLETSALLGRLGDEVSLWKLEVTGVSDVSPSMRRLTFTAPGLAELSYQPGQDLMMAIPGPNGDAFRRRYTIRSFNPAAPSIDIDIVAHGDGPGAQWASSAVAGSRIEAIGPRGKVIVHTSADWHLFIGDDSAIPASLAMAESLSNDDNVIVLLEVDGEDDRHQPARPLSIQWLFRRGVEPASSTALITALQEMELPEGDGHVYVAGEMGVVAQIRRHLMDRGLTKDQISSKPYWRAGVANASHGEPARE